MTDPVRGFAPGDVMARGIDPSKFKSKAVNSCWPAPPRAAPAEPPPPACARPRCDKPAATDGYCQPHAREECEWREVDVTRLRHATRLRGHPEGSPSPRHREGSDDG